MFWIVAEFIVFLASAVLALIVYLQNTSDIKALSVFITVILLGIAIARRSIEKKREGDRYEIANALSEFILEGNRLRNRADENPLPIQEHNNWIEKVETYLKRNKKSHLAVKLNDFSGYTFYGDGSEKSKFKNSIDGRIRRLHEFINQLNA